MIPTNNAPEVVAYFNVYTRFREGLSAEDVDRAVGRYLYSGFMGLPTIRSASMEGYWETPVRFADYNAGASRARYRVRFQRDRLSSGFYSTSEPVFYLPQPVEVSA